MQRASGSIVSDMDVKDGGSLWKLAALKHAVK